MKIDKKDQPEEHVTGNVDQRGKETVIPVVHEKVSIKKRVIDKDRIRIVKHVKQEEQSIAVPLDHEEIDIQTKHINQYVDDIPEAVRYEGDTMILSILKEVVVVRTLLEKEIHITKKKVQTQDKHTITLRKEEVIIEHSTPENSPPRQSRH
jgi:uncharacterized protein (TIGR02271 family)